MIADFIFQIVLAALVVAVWIDVGRLHRRLRRLEELSMYTYSLAYYMYYQKEERSAPSAVEAVVVGDEVAVGDAGSVKESCVMEFVSRMGCVDIAELVERCGVTKSFILNKLYRLKKLVSVTKEGKVCPKN